MADENFVTISLSPKLLLAFEEYGKEGESLGDFVNRLILYYLEEKNKTCGTCKQLSYTKFQESYCKRDGYKTSAERTCFHWEAEG